MLFFRNGWIWASLAIIILSTLLAYSNTLQAPFVFDDHLQIVENNRIKDINNFLSLDRLTAPRPLTDLTFAANYHFHGLDPKGFRAVNILIHTLSGIVVFFLSMTVLRLLSPSVTGRTEWNGRELWLISLLTALIFVLHPLQTQAVTYIVQRYTSMAALFYLSSVLLFILARQAQVNKGSFIKYAVLFFLCILSGILAFLSKQSAASLPAMLIVVEVLLFKSRDRSWTRSLSWLLPLVLVFLFFVLYSVGLFSGRPDFSALIGDVSSLMAETQSVSRLEYLFTQFTVIVLYIKLYLFPIGLNADPMHPFATSFFHGFTPWGFAILIGMLVVGIATRKCTPVAILGILWFFIALSVESSIIPIRDAMFEHRMYLPILGPAILTAWFLVFFKRKWPIPVIAICCFLVIGLGVLTYERNKVWGDEQLFWEDVLQKTPENQRALTNLGLVLERKGNWQQAMSYYNQALMLDSEYPYALLNLGALLGEKGHHSDAEDVLKRALDVKPRSARIHNNLGVLMAVQRKFDQALFHFENALKFDRLFLDASNNLALTYYNMGRKDDALRQFRKSLQISPGDEFATGWKKRLKN